jgi:hypothetical protein
MITNQDKNDSEPFTPKGKPLSTDELYFMAQVTEEDIAAGAATYMESVPPRFRRLLG